MQEWLCPFLCVVQIVTRCRAQGTETGTLPVVDIIIIIISFLRCSIYLCHSVSSCTLPRSLGVILIQSSALERYHTWVWLIPTLSSLHIFSGHWRIVCSYFKTPSKRCLPVRLLVPFSSFIQFLSCNSGVSLLCYLLSLGKEAVSPWCPAVGVGGRVSFHVEHRWMHVALQTVGPLHFHTCSECAHALLPGLSWMRGCFPSSSFLGLCILHWIGRGGN